MHASAEANEWTIQNWMSCVVVRHAAHGCTALGSSIRQTHAHKETNNCLAPPWLRDVGSYAILKFASLYDQAYTFTYQNETETNVLSGYYLRSSMNVCNIHNRSSHAASPIIFSGRQFFSCPISPSMWVCIERRLRPRLFHFVFLSAASVARAHASDGVIPSPITPCYRGMLALKSFISHCVRWLTIILA